MTGADALLDGSLVDLCAHVRHGEVSAREVVTACLARIARRDPALNAVVAIAEERVERRLAELDDAPPTGPLAGLPYLVKDLHADVDGLPLARGSRLFVGTPSPGTSELVRRIEAAGAVVVGRTNTPELGLDISTESALHGPCHNPYQRGVSTGGSSGGAAAAVAARMLPAAHASDSGGSIRVPAAWCGLVGLKPSRGANPAGPWRHDDWSGLSHEHALTRSVADSRALLAVTAGTYGRDPYCSVDPLAGDAPAVRRVGLVTSPPVDVPVDLVCSRAVAEVGDVLRDRGLAVVPVALPTTLAAIGPAVLDVIAGHLAGTVAAHELATGRVAGPDTLEPAVLDTLERGRRMSASEHRLAVLALRRGADALHDLLDEIDLVVTPTTALPAPQLGVLNTSREAPELFAEIVRHSPFAMPFNVSGGPALSLPWGVDDRGVPVGVQIAGPPGHDRSVLAVAEAVEAARPADRTPPPPSLA